MKWYCVLFSVLIFAGCKKSGSNNEYYVKYIIDGKSSIQQESKTGLKVTLRNEKGISIELINSTCFINSSNAQSFVFTATDGGYGKKTPVEEYRLQGRGGIGIKAAKIDEGSRGSLVSALVISDSDEVLAITSAGTVMRTPAAEVRQTGRDSMGVRLVNLDEGVSLLSVTRNGEDEISEEKQ